jgi:hypothetical protein
MLSGSPSDTEVVVFIASQYLPNPHCPWKPPDLRRLRIDYLIEHGRPPSPTLDDGSTWRGWRYLRGLHDCRDDTGRQRLAQEFPDVAAAVSFRDAAEPLRRAELEARLLANQTDDKIADRMGLTPAAVAAYHDLYFNVRPHLKASTWVANTVFGPKVHFGLTPDDHEMLLKVYGYGFGGRGVDDFLDYLRDPPVVPADLGGLGIEQLRALSNKLWIKIWALNMGTPASAASPQTWQWLRQRYDEAGQHRLAGSELAVLDSLRPILDVLEAAARGEEVRLPTTEAVPA